jgi:hypothetical protein
MGRPKTTITPGQCRAARALIGLSLAQLIASAKVPRAIVINFERETEIPKRELLYTIQRAL